MKPSVLCVVPPYPTNVPPAGAAALLAYLKVHGCHDFEFLDLRLWTPYAYAPTYSPIGISGESFVMDVPDLPLVLALLRAHERRVPLGNDPPPELEAYCRQRDLSFPFLWGWVLSLQRFLDAACAKLEGARFVGFSTWTSNYFSTLLLAARLKLRAAPPFIVVGGPQVTESRHSAELGLRAGLFDAVVVGEGEEALRALYDAFCAGGGHVRGATPGVMRAVGSGFEVTPRALLQLAQLPLPAFEEMPIASYRKSVGAKRTLPLQLSRGCTDKCSFCSEWVFWERFRSDDPEHVVAQIAELVRRFGLEEIAFTDSLLNGSLPRLRTFAEGLLREGLRVDWSGFMRAKIDGDTARLLQRAGLRSAFIGVESMSDETLALMNKRRTQVDNLDAIETFLDHGVRVRAGVIPGFPGDRRERFAKTVELLSDIQGRRPGLSLNVEPFILSPGQPIYGELARYGLATRPWPLEQLGEVPARYADIVAEIPWVVEGANQGMERLEQLRLAQRYADSRAVDAFSYRSGEEVSATAIAIDAIEPGWHLGKVKTAHGTVYSFVVDEEELSRLRALIAEAERDDERARPSQGGWLARAAFRDFFAELDRAHVIAGVRRHPAVAPTRFASAIAAGGRYGVSPFALARVIGRGRGRRLLLVEARSRWKTKLDLRLAPVLAELHRQPRTLRQLAAWLKREDDSIQLADLRGVLATLGQKGIVLDFAPAPNASPPAVAVVAVPGERAFRVSLPMIR